MTHSILDINKKINSFILDILKYHYLVVIYQIIPRFIIQPSYFILIIYLTGLTYLIHYVPIKIKLFYKFIILIIS